jgi:hypothetical protein
VSNRIGVIVTAVTEPLWTSIAVSLAPVVVALVALWIGAKQQNKTLHQQARQDDLTQARIVLEDAARALHMADQRRRALIDAYHDREKRAALRGAGQQLDEMIARLEIRFGRKHPVTERFSACVETVLALHHAIGDVQLDDDEAQAARSFRALGNEFAHELRPAFVDAAVAYAGLALEHRTPNALPPANPPPPRSTPEAA